MSIILESYPILYKVNAKSFNFLIEIFLGHIEESGDGAPQYKYSGPTASQYFDIVDTAISLGIFDLTL